MTRVLYPERMTNEKSTDTIRYASYLLGLRLIWNDDEPVWKASVENTATGSYRSFPNVEALATFLLAEFGGRTSKGSSQSEGPPYPGGDTRPREIE